MNIADEIKTSFKTGSFLTKLIYINLGVFLLIQIAIIFMRLFSSPEYIVDLIALLAVPTNLQELFTHPWTVITYMFTHKDFFHILFNLLWLYWFGKIFLSYLS